MAGGGDDAAGVGPRALEQLMAAAEVRRSGGWRFSFHASVLEIYNERLRDLLLPAGAPAPKLEVRVAGGGRVQIEGLSERAVGSAAEAAGVLSDAEARRSAAQTAMNERSSRSHSLLRVRVRCCEPGGTSEREAVLTLVDLAGSERLGTGDTLSMLPVHEQPRAREAEQLRRQEALCINRSLSALAAVLNAVRRGDSHVPYRDSKLTQLLQDSLGAGGSKCAMIATVSPAAPSLSESLCSLRFAAVVADTQLGAARRASVLEA